MLPENLFDLLPNRVLNLLTEERRLAFAQIAPDLSVSAFSGNLIEMFSSPDSAAGPIAGMPIGALFWEFAGAEQALEGILQGALPEFLIENANRDQPDGSVRYINLRVVPLEKTCPGEGLLLIVEDNTPVGTLEQALIQERNMLRLAQANLERANAALTRLNNMKSLFLSIAAHDLRAPLSSIRGYAGLIQHELKEENHQGETASFLSMIISQVDRLNHLISDLLDLEMIEQGSLIVRATTCDLVSLVREVIQMLLPVAVEQELSLTMIDPGGPVYIQSDPDKTLQILYNLIGNALKYTPLGGGVRVSCGQEDTWGVFSVSDNGRGIAQDKLSELFHLYHRTEEAHKSHVRGNGLGLFIVKSLVDRLGGEISVSSEIGQGTTFTVRLPNTAMPREGEGNAGQGGTGC